MFDVIKQIIIYNYIKYYYRSDKKNNKINLRSYRNDPNLKSLQNFNL